MLHHPCLFGGPQEGGNATSPLCSWGSTSGRKCYIAPAFLGVPIKGDKIRKGYITPAFWGPTRGRKCYVTLAFSGPISGRKCYIILAFSGVPNKGDKMKRGYITPAFSGAHKRAKALCNPCVLRGPHQRGQIRSGYIILAFSGAHKWAEMLNTPCVLGGPPQRGPNHTWLRHPCLLRGPQVGRNATSPLRSRGPHQRGQERPPSGWWQYALRGGSTTSSGVRSLLLLHVGL